MVALKDNFGEDDEAAVNLTTAGSAVFNMRDSGGGTKIARGSCTIDDANSGVVSYAWGTADVNTVGTFDAEVEVIWNDGKSETFPNDSYWEISIVDDIA